MLLFLSPMGYAMILTSHCTCVEDLVQIEESGLMERHCQELVMIIVKSLDK